MSKYTEKELLGGLVELAQDNFSVTSFIVDDMKHLPSSATYEYRFGSFTEAKLKAGLEVPNAVLCKDCGVHYSSISHHWSQTDCSFRILNERQKNILKGHLMGDATLGGRDRESPNISWVMTNLEYMEWLRDELGWICKDIKLKQTPYESKNSAKESGFDENEDNEYKTLYQCGTHGHPWFKQIDWYKSGEKIFPENLKLNSTMVKIWYCDDGGLIWSERANEGHAHIHASSQTQSMNRLVDEFNRHNIYPTIREGNVGLDFTLEETEKLLEWMGEPPDGMEYKWSNKEKEVYQ